MRLPRFDYFEPKTIKEACSLLTEYKGTAKVLAGGSDLLVSMKQKTVTPRQIINLKPIADLNFVSFNKKQGLKLGAMATLRTLETSPVVRANYPMLAQAAHAVASIHIRNFATVGGNVCLNPRCWYYNQHREWRRTLDPCFKAGGKVCHMVKGAKYCWALFSADVAPALIALGAKARLSAVLKERTVPLQDIYTGRGEPYTKFRPGEFITEIEVPPMAPGARGVYLKHAIPPTGMDFPIVGVAALIEGKNDHCQNSSVVVTGVASAPFIATDAEETIKGKSLTDALILKAAQAAAKQAKPVPHSGVTAAYRRKMIEVFVKRALTKALKA